MAFYSFRPCFFKLNLNCCDVQFNSHYCAPHVGILTQQKIAELCCAQLSIYCTCARMCHEKSAPDAFQRARAIICSAISSHLHSQIASAEWMFKKKIVLVLRCCCNCKLLQTSCDNGHVRFGWQTAWQAWQIWI